jgi:TP901 family phage tail tape measure protein
MAARFTIAQLVVDIQANLQQFKLQLGQGLSQVSTFSSSIGGMTSGLMKFSRGLGIISASMISTGGLMLKIFADLEQSIANTASVTGDATKGVQELEDFAREMGRETIFTATQSAEAMYFLGSAGYKAGEIFSSLESILSLAAATQYDLSETSATVVSVLRAFGLQADQASRVTNVFAQSIADSQATMLKLQTSMKYIAPVAAMLNLELEEVTAALSLLYDSGLEASMAGTQLRMALTRLVKPTRASMDAIRALGIEYENINPASKNLVEIIRELEDANAGAADKAKYMAEMFGVRAVNAMGILVKNGSAALDELSDRITGTTKASEMQQRQIDTLKGTWRLMIAAMQDVSIIIGKVLRPMMMALMESIRQLGLIFTSLPGWIQGTIVGLGILITVFAGLGSTVLLIIASLPKLIAFFGVLSTGLATLGAPLALTITLLAALGAGIIYVLSAREREKRSIRNTILEYDNLLNNRRKELSMTVKLIDQIKKLDGSVGDNVTKYRHLEAAVNKLNTINPGLIDDQIELSLQMDKLVGVSADASIELEKIAMAKEKITKYKLTDEIITLNKEIDKLKESLSGVSTGKFFSEHMFVEVGNAALNVSKKSKEVFLEDISEINSGFSGTATELDKIGVVLDRGLYPRYYKIRREIVETAKTEAGRAELTKAQDDLLSKSVENRINGLEDVAGVELQIVKMINDTLMDYEKLAEKEKELKELSGDRLNANKKVLGEVAALNIEMTKEEMKHKKDEEDLMYDIASAGVVNRIQLRKMELEKYKNDMVYKMVDLGYDEVTAKQKIEGAYLRKKIEMNMDNAKDIAEFENMVLLKGNNDILQNKIFALNEWKISAKRSAMEIGKDTKGIDVSYEKEMMNIRKDFLKQYNDLVIDMSLGTKEFEVDAMRESVGKELAVEDLKYKQKLANAEKSRVERMESVEKGLITELSVQQEYYSKINSIELEHNNSVLKINESTMRKRIDLLKEFEIEKMKSKNYGKDPMEMEISEENVSYQEKINNLEESLYQRLELVKQGRIDEQSVISNFNAVSESLNREHYAKLNYIRLSYDIQEWETELGKIDDDTVLYDKKLELYMKFLESKKLLLEGDLESYKKLTKEIDDVDKEKTDKKKKRDRENADQTLELMEIVGTAIGKTGQGATDAWKDASKAIVKMIAERIKMEAKLNMLVAAASQNWTGAAAWAVAYGAVSALENVAYGRIDAAAYGANVKTTGIAKVHEGEVIMPSSLVSNLQSPFATLSRNTWDNYSGLKSNNNSVISSGKNLNVRFDFNVNAEGSIIYPANTDAADQFFERIILPAEKRFKKALGTVIGE